MKEQSSDAAHPPHIMILGIGNILFADEGFGVRVAEAIEERYEFNENVSVVDGGVLGLNLLGVMSEADHLIVIDAVKSKQPPGTLYRIDDDGIPQRARAKNSLHQIDFLEAYAILDKVLDKKPRTVIFGVEPADITTLADKLTEATAVRLETVIDLVIEEVARLGGEPRKRSA